MDQDFSEFRLFYELNKDKFPEDFRGTVEEFAEWATFYYEVYEPCAERMIPQLKRLLLKQYPDLKGAMHPSQVKYIGEIVETTPFSLVFGMKRLLKEQRDLKDARDKYPKIDEWREFYGKPEEPGTVSDESRNMFLWSKDEDWEKYKAEQNEEMRIFHEWQQKRLKEYYDIVQPLLFEYMPELENFEGDFWVLYAVTLRDEYESWKDNCEHLENSIEYHLPPESVDWEWEVYKEALREARPKWEKEVLRRRDERIHGK